MKFKLGLLVFALMFLAFTVVGKSTSTISEKQKIESVSDIDIGLVSVDKDLVLNDFIVTTPYDYIDNLYIIRWKFDLYDEVDLAINKSYTKIFLEQNLPGNKIDNALTDFKTYKSKVNYYQPLIYKLPRGELRNNNLVA